MESIKSYKGFNKDMTCREFQYEEGEEYETETAEVCKSGFHACEYPLDVFNYYAPNDSTYHVVEQSGEISKPADDTKVASTKIKIGASISIAGLVKAAIEYTTKRAIKESDEAGDCGAASSTGYKGAASSTGYKGAASSTGDCGAASSTGYKGAASSTGYKGAASSTGYKGAASSTGDCGAASSTGYKGAASSTGDCGAASSTGDCGAASSTGYKGAASSTGYKGAASSTGDCGAASSTGDCGAASSTGYKGAASAENPSAVAVAWGYKSKAKGVKGSHLVFADWEGDESEYWKPDSWTLKGAKMVQVDGEWIKENTWYVIENGTVKELKE
jgi:hypothetical protein